MRILTILLLLLSTLAWSQPVLTITDAKKANPVAAYTYFLEDFTHKLTYEKVSHFPLDSFGRLSRTDVMQLGYRRGTVWMRFSVKNQTDADLFLISFYRRHKQLDVFVEDETGNLIYRQGGYDLPLVQQQIPVVPPVIPLGRKPKTIVMRILTVDALGDYLHIGDVGQALVYQKHLTRWQSMVLGAYGIIFLLALLFFVRLRDPLIGWYALLMFSITVFYLDFYGFLNEYINYSWWRQYVPTSWMYMSCWSLFHLKFLNLRHYSKTLYWLVIAPNAIYWIDWPISKTVTALTGKYFSLLYELLYWLGIDWGGLIQITLFLLLISMMYVSLKNFRNVFLYAIAFSIGLIGMIISMFAVYDIDWLPHYPYNNMFVPGTLVEIIMLAYILADRASQQRRQQVRTQQQLIDQLHENLRHKAKLLQIRDEIARDLHDEVGATLTSIAISTKLVQKKIGLKRTDISPILEQIQTDSQETIHSLRDTVWALNPDNDSPEKLLERMRGVGFQLLANQDIALAFEQEVSASDLPAFSMAQRRNLYYVFKEAIHNIVKHAQATRVTVRVFRQAGELHIRITDNGKGFEPVPKRDGNGLANFQKRASEGGFSVAVCSDLGWGTTIEMRIPVRETTHIGG